MSKKSKYIVIALVFCAVLMFGLYFVLGSKKEYTIVFDSTGGTEVASIKVKEKGKVTKPANPTKENYNFIRWEYDNKEYDFNKEVTSNMTLKAVWEGVQPPENYYDIEFIVNGVSKKMSLSKITEEDLAALGFEEKEGYEIVWYVNDQVYNFTEPLNGNMTITGKYVKTTTFTVKFNSDGGTSVDSQKVKQNELATEPEAITKYGFIFDGWYLNNKKYEFSTPVTKNITLVAKWKEDETIPRFEVTFDSDGGTKVDKQKIIQNEVAKEPKTPTKTGYKFLGWYLNDTKYDFSTKVTANVALKAQWEKLAQFTVTFNKDNGTENETKQVYDGEKVTKPSNPKKEGYKFVKWMLDSKEFNFNTPITADITLIASYTPLAQYTVTFDSNGGSQVQSQSVYEGDKATKPSNPTKANSEFVEWQLNGKKYDFNTTVTKDITLVAKWNEVTYNYKVVATKVDNYSPDSNLTIYRGSTVIPFNNNIKVNGVTLTSAIINTEKLKGKVVTVIDGGTEHTATVEFR